MANDIQILGTVTDKDGSRIPNVNVTINFEDEANILSLQTGENGSYLVEVPGTYGPPKSIQFTSGEYLTAFKDNLTKSGQSTSEGGSEVDVYQVNVTLQTTNIDLSEQQAELQIQTQEIENIEIEVSNFVKQPSEVKFAIVLNKIKENLKRTLFPFILALLIPFGVKFVQAILDKIPNPTPDACPDPEKIKELIRKRNQLVRQLNQIYRIISTLTQVLTVTGVVIQALQIGLQIAKAFANPTTASSETVFKKIELRLEVAGIAVNILTITAAIIGVVLQTIINLLNQLDIAIQGCSEEQNIPFEELNNELNALANQTIEETQQSSDTYKGFTFEIKLDEVNTSPYPKRYAQALNIQGVPVLKSDSSFASNPQVLIDQLKFIIDTQNLRGD